MSRTYGEKLAERISKLPDWARKHIADLEARLAEAEKTVEDYRAGHPGSPVTYSRGLGDYSNLPAESVVRFAFGEKLPDGRYRHWVEVGLREQRSGRFAVGLLADSAIVLKGSSSNAFEIDVTDRYELRDDAHIRDLAQTILEKATSRGLNYNDLHDLIDAAPESREEIRRAGEAARVARRRRDSRGWLT